MFVQSVLETLQTLAVHPHKAQEVGRCKPVRVVAGVLLLKTHEPGVSRSDDEVPYPLLKIPVDSPQYPDRSFRTSPYALLYPFSGHARYPGEFPDELLPALQTGGVGVNVNGDSRHAEGEVPSTRILYAPPVKGYPYGRYPVEAPLYPLCNLALLGNLKVEDPKGNQKKDTAEDKEDGF